VRLLWEDVYVRPRRRRFEPNDGLPLSQVPGLTIQKPIQVGREAVEDKLSNGQRRPDAINPFASCIPRDIPNLLHGIDKSGKELLMRKPTSRLSWRS